jgi:heat shock protein HslJ
MRSARIGIGLTLAICCICFMAAPQEQNITVRGQLTRAMAIGGESTGWAIQLDSETNIDGKQVHSIEIQTQDISQLESLQDKRVRATGKIVHRRGVETGNRAILDVSSIREIKAKPAAAAAIDLTGSEWLLEDLAGSGVIDNVQATLAFPEAGKLAGNGSCNRFFGSAQITGDAIKLSPLGVTRRACPEAVMNQETKYLKALQAAERFEQKDSYLLVYCRGFEKPLRFTRKSSSTPAVQQ